MISSVTEKGIVMVVVVKRIKRWLSLRLRLRFGKGDLVRKRPGEKEGGGKGGGKGERKDRKEERGENPKRKKRK